MINKKLITYATRAKFDTDESGGLIPSTSIVFIQNTGELWTHGKFFGGNFSSVDSNYGTLLTKGSSINLSRYGHRHAYTDLTGSTTTANQAIVSNGTANGWTLATLGSNAFNSTSYLPLSGGTMTGPLTISMGFDRKIVINNTDTDTNYSYISFQQNGTEYGMLGTSASGLDYNGSLILTAGNYSSYNPLINGAHATNGTSIYAPTSQLSVQNVTNSYLVGSPNTTSLSTVYCNPSVYMNGSSLYASNFIGNLTGNALTATTATKITATSSTTTLAYLLGVTGTGVTPLYDPNIYITTTAGNLYASTFIGNLTGTASQATNSYNSGIKWTNTVTVGSWSSICLLPASYGAYILTITFSQNSEASCNTYLVNTGYTNALIVQLNSTDFGVNYSLQIRVTQNGSSETLNFIEVLEPFGYNGATTLNIQCALNRVDNSTIIGVTTYTAYTATAGGTVLDTITSSKNKMVANLAGTADVATLANTINANSSTTTQAYLLGVTASGTTPIYDPGIYITSTSGTLHAAYMTATTFTGNLTGTASNATLASTISSNLNTNTKGYLLAQTASGTTPFYDSGIYIGTASGNLIASTFTGSLVGNASTSNTATVLANTRLLWGQGFDGSGDITGNISNTGNITPSISNTYTVGVSANYYSAMYATTFYGALSGTASYATYAGHVTNSISFKNISNTTVTYNGSSPLDLTGGIYYSATSGNANAVGGYGESSFIRYRGALTGPTHLALGIYEWADGSYATNNLPSQYGDALEIVGGTTWYHRLCFNTNGTLSFYLGINTTTMSFKGTLAFAENVPTKTGSGASGTWGISISGNAATATSAILSTKLSNLFGSRPTDANIIQTGSGGLSTFKATYLMTSNKPASDGHILHMYWDNTGGYDSQLFIGNGTNYYVQYRNSNAGTWGSWVTLLDSLNYNSYNPIINDSHATSATSIYAPTSLLSVLNNINSYLIGSTSTTSLNTLYSNGSVYMNGSSLYASTFIGNLTGTASNATNIYVNYHSGNNVNYPIVWTNQVNTSNIQDNLLYKTTNNLYFNPSTMKLTSTGGFVGNLSGTSDYATYSTHLYTDGSTAGTSMTFHWTGLTGQPIWLWGGSSASDMYVYNPSNFSVNYATSSNTTNILAYMGSQTMDTSGTLTGGVQCYGVYNNGYPTTYGNVINIAGQGYGQLLIGWSGTAGAHADNYIRSLRDSAKGTNGWSDWAKIITSANYNSYALPLTGGTISGAVTVAGSITGNSGIELYGGTPCIDFHFNNSTSDYTSRIIENVLGTLTVTGGLTVTGATNINNTLTATGICNFKSLLYVDKTVDIYSSGLYFKSSDGATVYSNFTSSDTITSWLTAVGSEFWIGRRGGTRMLSMTNVGSNCFATIGYSSSLQLTAHTLLVNGDIYATSSISTYSILYNSAINSLSFSNTGNSNMVMLSLGELYVSIGTNFTSSFPGNVYIGNSYAATMVLGALEVSGNGIFNGNISCAGSLTKNGNAYGPIPTILFSGLFGYNGYNSSLVNYIYNNSTGVTPTFTRISLGNYSLSFNTPTRFSLYIICLAKFETDNTNKGLLYVSCFVTTSGTTLTIHIICADDSLANDGNFDLYMFYY